MSKKKKKGWSLERRAALSAKLRTKWGKPGDAKRKAASEAAKAPHQRPRLNIRAGVTMTGYDFRSRHYFDSTPSLIRSLRFHNA